MNNAFTIYHKRFALQLIALAEVHDAPQFNLDERIDTVLNPTEAHSLAYKLMNTLTQNTSGRYVLGLPAQSLQLVWGTLTGCFIPVHAAGGFVVLSQAQNTKSVLIIVRHGVSDLPKGKLEESETPEVAALREVEEETGIKCNILPLPAAITYHIYPYASSWALKTTWWYGMEALPPATLQLQTEESITAAKWQLIHELTANSIGALNTYSSITAVLHHFVGIMQD